MYQKVHQIRRLLVKEDKRFQYTYYKISLYLGILKYKIQERFTARSFGTYVFRVSRQLAPNTRVIKIDNRRLSFLVLDLGCGCGAQGIAAIKCGAKTPVTFNDIDPDALEAVTLNNQANDINSSPNSIAAVLNKNDYLSDQEDPIRLVFSYIYSSVEIR